MLVLARRQSESILIADNIEIRVIQLRGGVVRLGITAPREISVRRSELGQTAPIAEPEIGTVV